MTDAQRLAEAFGIAEKVEEILSGLLHDEPVPVKCDPCDPKFIFGRLGNLNGRLIAITRPDAPPAGPGE